MRWSLTDSPANADEIIAILVGEIFQNANRPTEPKRAEFFEDPFPVGGQMHVDFAFVGLIEFAVDEGLFKPVLERAADDARHLGGAGRR